MDYDCHVVPADKMLMDPTGVKEPLCNDCKTPDCTNPIKDKMVSIFGQNKKYRLWIINNQCRQVISCRGYIVKNEIYGEYSETQPLQPL